MAWSKILSSRALESGPLVVQTLQYWQDDTALADIRDAKALAKLPEAERKAWQSLWAEVDALLKQAKTGQTPKAKVSGF